MRPIAAPVGDLSVHKSRTEGSWGRLTYRDCSWWVQSKPTTADIAGSGNYDPPGLIGQARSLLGSLFDPTNLP